MPERFGHESNGWNVSKGELMPSRTVPEVQLPHRVCRDDCGACVRNFSEVFGGGDKLRFLFHNYGDAGYDPLNCFTDELKKLTDLGSRWRTTRCAGPARVADNSYGTVGPERSPRGS